MYGSRWNPFGVPALYLAAPTALAMLDILMRAPTLQHQNHFIVAEIEVDRRRLPSYLADPRPKDGMTSRPVRQAESWENNASKAVCLAFGFPASSFQFRP